ncbi:hypothetical protein V8F20_003333 [Naviculisporaceae sp. PSN 640]
MAPRYLIDFLPKNGFIWNDDPRVTRTDARDVSIVQAFREVTGRQHPYKSHVLPILGRIFEYLAAEIDTIRGGMGGDVTIDSAGNRNYEDFHEFLVRMRDEAIRFVAAGTRQYLRLLTILPTDSWCDLVYRIIKAHEQWEEETHPVIKQQVSGTLPAFWRCVWRFRDAAKAVWERDRDLFVAAVDPRGYLEGMTQAEDGVPWGLGSNWLAWAMTQDHEGDGGDEEMKDADAGEGEGEGEGGEAAENEVGNLRERISALDIESVNVEDPDVNLYDAED